MRTKLSDNQLRVLRAVRDGTDMRLSGRAFWAAIKSLKLRDLIHRGTFGGAYVLTDQGRATLDQLEPRP